jgi:hypothetical protein
MKTETRMVDVFPRYRRAQYNKLTWVAPPPPPHDTTLPPPHPFYFKEAGMNYTMYF